MTRCLSPNARHTVIWRRASCAMSLVSWVGSRTLSRLERGEDRCVIAVVLPKIRLMALRLIKQAWGQPNTSQIRSYSRRLEAPALELPTRPGTVTVSSQA
jgi:hypothetical protein